MKHKKWIWTYSRRWSFYRNFRLPGALKSCAGLLNNLILISKKEFEFLDIREVEELEYIVQTLKNLCEQVQNKKEEQKNG